MKEQRSWRRRWPLVVGTVVALAGCLTPSPSYAAPGTAPTITSAASVELHAGSSFHFTITTTGSPTPVVMESGLLPPGLGFQAMSNGTAVIQGTTSVTVFGSYPVTITATNGVSPDAVQQLVLTFATTTTTTTTTSLSSTPNPSGVGQVVTYTLKVAPVPNGGDVTIEVPSGGSLPGCIYVPVSTATGVATCKSSTLLLGSFQLKAAYSGYGTFSPSTSSGYNQFVIYPPPGYWLATTNGHVYGLGGAPSLGGLTTTATTGPVVGIAGAPGGKGYWVVTANGTVKGLGEAKSYGDLPASGIHVSDIVAIDGSPDGQGYYLVGADGGVFTFGDTYFHGSLPEIRVHTSGIVGMAASTIETGYLLVGRDGGVFSFGSTNFHGSLPGIGVHVTNIRSLEAASTGTGYMLVGAEGGAFVFGTGVKFHGSLPGEGIRVDDIIGIALPPDNGGYWMAGADGQVYGFGNAKVEPPPNGLRSNLPVAAIAGT